MSSANGIVAYAGYVPRYRVQREEMAAGLGAQSGPGARVVAGCDEDSTTMGVEAAAALLATLPEGDRAPAGGLYLATTSPAYADKANAAAVHAALDLPSSAFAADVAGSARSGMAAWRAAAADGGMAVMSDVRRGLPGSGDERTGGDGAAAFLFGDADHAVAEIVAQVSETAEILDRWRAPGGVAAGQWEERFGVEAYQPLAERAVRAVTDAAGGVAPDHAVVVSPNPGVAKRVRRLAAGAVSTTGSPVGHAGAADVGLGVADALDRAQPGDTILVLSVADGCDALMLRVTDRIAAARQPHPVADQLTCGIDVPYPTYLAWRGLLEREPPRRPEPDRPAGPPSARGARWKFAFTGARCLQCGFVHLPPQRVCKGCRAVDDMVPCPLARSAGTVATYTVDHLAFSPSPPLIEAVIDFDGGGRYTLEVADAAPETITVGTRVTLTFRMLYTSHGVHNYFWKARVADTQEPGYRQATPDAKRGADHG
ncbi:3-hydroxy-3-methylglutaryl CoA synthase [Haloechinothrix alba]|uniref:3-hydroxy-3-methylglutaryl CoA synthase n=1 Tax=Haloechinothrix alba TaxID=664784 RepID=A0A238ZH25_9PSEU|nr:OB-fold domain-containing protein [Haloechinothrix alba]SNR82765.1 3-hydroxy-3-methylglutaryl CoA synthase [Haloechinothrix alba]